MDDLAHTISLSLKAWKNHKSLFSWEAPVIKPIMAYANNFFRGLLFWLHHRPRPIVYYETVPFSTLNS
jgi:hypothetical protein